MSQQYSVLFLNHSQNSGNVCMYQTDPDIGVNDVQSLAWFTKYVHPQTRVEFYWKVDYSFVWAETGELVPGVRFIASQMVPADLEGRNKIPFNHVNGGFKFGEVTQGTGGRLMINEEKHIPFDTASVGIGMSGKGTLVVQAQPNMNLVFTPKPKYWIAFGNYTEGEVLDLSEMTYPAEIVFPVNVYSMTAILNPDNTWTIKPTAEVNQMYVQAKGKQSHTALWGAL